MNIWILTPCI